ncbi:MAG: IS110 family transposase [Actinomycetota bacterium]
MIFVGVDWSEDHHDVEVRDEEGRRLVARRIAHGVDGVASLHELVGSHVESPGEVVVGIETDRGLLVSSLVAAGYHVFAVNPRSVDRYRDRHSLSGAKSDAGDAIVLAEMVRTDRHHHRQVAGDSAEVSALKIVARSHQNLIWARTRHVLQLRNVLLEYYPGIIAAAEGKVGSRDALAVLAAAPRPDDAARLTSARIAAILRRGGRERYVERTAQRFAQHLKAEHLQANESITSACAASARALVAIIATFDAEIEQLESELAERFNAHDQATVIRSLPGLGTILGARLLAEFGDDPDRYDSARARRNYAGTSPITRASGKSKAVLARFVRNRRLADACDRWAFAALSASPGARRYYDERRATGKTHGQALRALSNRLVGIFHGCVTHHHTYNEDIAWHRYAATAA